MEESGPAHSRVFTAELWIGGRPYGRGEGRSKKEAEQKAAAEALAKFTAEASEKK